MKGPTAATAALCALLGGSPFTKRCQRHRTRVPLCNSDDAEVASSGGHHDVMADSAVMDEEMPVDDRERRRIVEAGMLLLGSSAVSPGLSCFAEEGFSGVEDPRLANYQPFANDDSWRSTALPIRSISEACEQAERTGLLDFGRWPDPALRREASSVPRSVFDDTLKLEELATVARALRSTARKEGAVGLAAQQCGVDASILFIDHVSSQRIQQGIALINPRIIRRSPETEMQIWTEECLVLPPEFRATLLRDKKVTIEYESLESIDGIPYFADGLTKQITLSGELARCAQHEMDHSRGVLITDHVSLSEMLPAMASIENSDGRHDLRTQRAYSRYLSESTLLPQRQLDVALADEDSAGFFRRIVRPVYAEDGSTSEPSRISNSYECDEDCKKERRRRIEQRRAMMEQSRSNTSRGDVLKLSQQRALMYGTEFKGLQPKYCPQQSCP